MPRANPTPGDSYYLDPSLERIVVTMCASRPSFWGRIGHAIDPDCLDLEPAKRILRACRQIDRETKRPPESPVLVLQLMRQWLDEGKADGNLSLIKECAVIFDDALDTGLLHDDAAVARLKPILARRLKDQAVIQAIDEQGKDGDFARVIKLLDKANTLGDVDTNIGVEIGPATIEEIRKRSRLDRLGTGVWELDNLIDMGMRRGCLGIFIGGAGDGKSMSLSHAAAYAIRGNGGAGLATAYATLELPSADVAARIIANLTGASIDAVLTDPDAFATQLANIPHAPLIVQNFTPQGTTMADIEAWITKCEEKLGRRIDVVVTDYGDKLVAPKNAGKDADSGYSQGRVVFERMRLFAHETGRWHWTASQGKRQEKKGRTKDAHQVLDLNDVADSMHKVRVADLVVTINNIDDRGVKWHVAKNRFGVSKRSTEVVPADFACGRVSPILVVDPNQETDW